MVSRRGACADCMDAVDVDGEGLCMVCGAAVPDQAAATQAPARPAAAAAAAAAAAGGFLGLVPGLGEAPDLDEMFDAVQGQHGLGGLLGGLGAFGGGGGGAPPASESALSKLTTETVDEKVLDRVQNQILLKVAGLQGEVILSAADFGPRFPRQLGPETRLVLVDPVTAHCTLQNADPDELKGAVAVVQRGISTFAAKSARLAAAGAVAAIVCQHVEAWPYVMTDSRGELNTLGSAGVPMAMISKDLGKRLMDLLADPGQQQQPQQHRLSVKQPAAAGGEQEGGGQVEECKERTPAEKKLGKAEAEQERTGAPTCLIECKDQEKDCPICQERFKLGDKIIHMPCSHLFHADCLSQWLARRNTCPNCRYELPTGNSDYDSVAAVRAAQRREEGVWVSFFS